ncbi:hypothetical protein MESS4_190001 [Mesorhizobium sp. STM 4661]|nr:hypothetical protein MESS4_190001 [Mesorhizobium sp. STM 4661]
MKPRSSGMTEGGAKELDRAIFQQNSRLVRQIRLDHSPNCALVRKIDKKFRRHICILSAEAAAASGSDGEDLPRRIGTGLAVCEDRAGQHWRTR